MSSEVHWETIYKNKPADAVSWYRPHLERSLALIERASTDQSAYILDVGGGESTLVDDLLAKAYRNITVLDISETALAVTKRRLGAVADRVRWIAADITKTVLPHGCFDVWHDRAVFHFLTDQKDRVRYVRNVALAVKSGGHVIVSTFGPEGPTRCSGLEVVRYDSEALHGEFGERFQLIESSKEEHQTPWGTTQQFLYCHCAVR